jgi:hypothetical protein
LRKLTAILAASAALLAAGCTHDNRGPDLQRTSDVARPMPQTNAASSNPLPSAGASDSVGAGSVSNAASGSSTTRLSAPGPR